MFQVYRKAELVEKIEMLQREVAGSKATPSHTEELAQLRRENASLREQLSSAYKQRDSLFESLYRRHQAEGLA